MGLYQKAVKAILTLYVIWKLNCGWVSPKETIEAPSAYYRNVKEYFEEDYNEIKGL